MVRVNRNEYNSENVNVEYWRNHIQVITLKRTKRWTEICIDIDEALTYLFDIMSKNRDYPERVDIYLYYGRTLDIGFTIFPEKKRLTFIGNEENAIEAKIRLAIINWLELEKSFNKYRKTSENKED